MSLPDPGRRLVIDPVAGFPTILEDAQTIPALLGPGFEVIESGVRSRPGLMHGVP